MRSWRIAAISFVIFGILGFIVSAADSDFSECLAWLSCSSLGAALLLVSTIKEENL
tara:strand:+ start:190 stop:357 length:168 start_codon:yes stop_codon:yes gene_type:complete